MKSMEFTIAPFLMPLEGAVSKNILVIPPLLISATTQAILLPPISNAQIYLVNI
jgi:hypothetical protein